MQIPNPNDGKPFQRVIKDGNGEPLYGIRNEHTPDEEIVHIPSNQSTTKYWQPEMVMNPEGCPHVFHIYDMGKREVQCNECGYAITFHPAINLREENGNAFVTIKGKEYQILP